MKRDAVEHLLRMIKGKEPRVRKCADRIVSNMATDVSNWSDVRLSFSVITRDYNGIIFHSRDGHKSGFYDRNDNPWDISLRGDEYWAALLQIVKWYYKKRSRYIRGRNDV
jgi:hypothetical protein